MGPDGILYTVKADNTASTENSVTNATYYTPAISAALTGKLNGIQAGAQVNVLEAVQINGTPLSINNNTVNIPIATAGTLGVVLGKAVTTEDKQAAIDTDGSIKYTDTTYEVFSQGKSGLVPATSDGTANKYLSADGTFRLIETPEAPEYTLASVTDSTKGQITLKKDVDTVSTINIQGSGTVSVQSDAAGTVTISAADQPNRWSYTQESVSATTTARWTTITIDGTTYQAVTVDKPSNGHLVVTRVYSETSVTVGSDTASTLKVQLDAPIVDSTNICYILLEEKENIVIETLTEITA